jgi:ER lumen protein retaining receptor
MQDVIFFVLGYYIHFAASCVLLYKIYKQKSIYGLSFDTQIAFLLAAVARAVWTLDTRLTETVFAYFELVVSIFLAIIINYLCFTYGYTNTKMVSAPLRIYILAPACLLLAFFFHPGDDWFTIQILVSFTMYMEAAGLLPQLWLMRHMREVEALTSHYVALLIIARACRMIFWGVLFYMGEHFLGLFLADILHTLFSADYMYLWLRKINTGETLVYSSSSFNV